MSASHPQISALISATALGDRAAFARLYDLTSAKLFGVALRILQNRADAEEVMQEIYVKIWRRADTYAVSGFSPMSWLITIARNQALDKLRARRTTTDDLDAAFDIATDAPTPEQAAMQSDQRRVLDACLAELDHDRAEAVRLAYLDGHAYQELADRFSVPLNTMRTWLRRSLQSLRECLSR